MSGTMTTRTYSTEGCGPSWDNCPTDVLLAIFEVLPVCALAVCMFVNSTWRTHVEYVLKAKNKWKDLVHLVTNYNGLQLKAKCEISCDWQQVFYNYILWHNVEKASIELQQVQTIDNIKKLNIFKDHLTVVTHNNVQCYDAKTLSNKSIMEVNNCQDFKEVEDMVILVIETPKYLNLEVYKKSSHDFLGFNMNRKALFTIEDVLCYKIHDNHCYFLDMHNSLYTFRGNMLLFYNAKFDGNPSSKYSHTINVYNNQLYLLSNDLRPETYCDKDRLMLWMDPNKRNFSKMSSVKEPPKNVEKTDHKMFYSYCQDDAEARTVTFRMLVTRMVAVVNRLFTKAVPKTLQIERHAWYNAYKKSVVIVYNLINVACMLQHGNLLFLGYSDGTVEIISPRDHLNLGRLLRFKLKDLQEDIVDLRIISIELFEEETIQHLYIATSSQIFHLHFTHKDSDRYMWNDEVCRKSVLPRVECTFGECKCE